MNPHPTGGGACGASRAVWPSLGDWEPDTVALREVRPSTEVFPTRQWWTVSFAVAGRSSVQHEPATPLCDRG